MLLIWNATCLVTCEYKSQIAFLSSNSTENYTRSHVELYHSKNVLNATKLHRNDVANNTKYFAESIGSQSYHLAFAVLLYSKALARGVYNDTTKEVSLATYRIHSALSSALAEAVLTLIALTSSLLTNGNEERRELM